MALFAGHKTLKWFVIGICLGVAACLGISAIVDPAVWGLGNGAIARGFLGINALCCLCWGYLKILNGNLTQQSSDRLKLDTVRSR